MYPNHDGEPAVEALSWLTLRGVGERLWALKGLLALLSFWVGGALGSVSLTLTPMVVIFSLVGGLLALWLTQRSTQAPSYHPPLSLVSRLRGARWLQLTLLCVAATALGALISSHNQQRQHAQRLAWLSRDLMGRPLPLLKAELLALRRRGERYQLTLKLTQAQQHTQAQERAEPQESAEAEPITALLHTNTLPQGAAQGAQLWLTPPSSGAPSLSPPQPPPSPHAFNESEHLSIQGVSVRARGALWLAQEGPRFWLALHELREALYAQLLSLGEGALGEGGRLTLALSLGDPHALPPASRARLQKLGLAHLFAVSGLHVGLLAFLLAYLARALSALLGSLSPYRWGALTLIVSSWGVALLAQLPLSAMRAALMVSLYALATLTHRRISPLALLTCAGWLITLPEPRLAQTLSFQLSWCAVFALCVTLPHTHTKLGRALAVSAAASLATSVPLAWHFGTFAPLSALNNALITPLASLTLLPLTLLGVMSWALLCSLSPALAHSSAGLSLLKVSAHSSEALASLTDLLPAWSELSLVLGQRGALPLLLLTLLWVTLTSAQRGHRALFERVPFKPEHFIMAREALFWRTRLAPSLLAALLALLLSLGALKGLSSPPASLTALSVGQGDATLLLNGEGEAALFDVGPRFGGRQVKQLLHKLGVSELAWVALSHLHPDHYEGLAELLGEVEVRQVLYHGREPPSHSPPLHQGAHQGAHGSHKQGAHPWRELRAELELRGVPLVRAREGAHRWGHLELEWGLSAPHTPLKKKRPLKENDASLALLVKPHACQQPHAPCAALLSGDLERAGEARLSAWWRERERAPLLLWQADHHGSRTSSHDATLKALKPRLSTISLGAYNRYGFPHPRALASMERAGLRWARTDLEGDLTLSWGAQGERAQLEGEGRGLPRW